MLPAHHPEPSLTREIQAILRGLPRRDRREPRQATAPPSPLRSFSRRRLSGYGPGLRHPSVRRLEPTMGKGLQPHIRGERGGLKSTALGRLKPTLLSDRLLAASRRKPPPALAIVIRSAVDRFIVIYPNAFCQIHSHPSSAKNNPLRQSMESLFLPHSFSQGSATSSLRNSLGSSVTGCIERTVTVSWSGSAGADSITTPSLPHPSSDRLRCGV